MSDTDSRLVDVLRQRYRAEISALPDGLDVPDSYHEARFKGFAFLAVGPVAYEKVDPLGQPPGGFPESENKIVRVACGQLLDWRGLVPGWPFDGLGIHGFYLLMRLLGFAPQEQTALLTESDPGYVYDRMEMLHLDGERLVLFNRVQLSGGEG